MLGWAILKTIGWKGEPSEFTIRPKPKETGLEKLKRLLGFDSEAAKVAKAAAARPRSR